MDSKTILQHEVIEYVGILRACGISNKLRSYNSKCYGVYMLLRCVFPEARPYMYDGVDHIVSKIGGDYYDINGLVDISKSYADVIPLDPFMEERCIEMLDKNVQTTINDV